MAALLLDIAALDCAALAACLAQRAHAVRADDRLTLVLAVPLLALGAGLLALAKVA